MAEEAKPKYLFCGMPKRGKSVEVHEAAVAHYLPSQIPENFPKYFRAVVESSLLTHGFNRLWCGALGLRESHGVSHFGMIHSDIGAPPGWADTLLAEMERVDADLISAVVPIKDERGLTSTGYDTTDDEFSPTRYTMSEVFDMDVTFTHPRIVVNTGLWLCRMDRDWCEKVFFRQQDQVVKGGDGKFYARTSPEDWDFSRQVRKHGGRIFATRAVKLFHERPEFHNRKPWGKWEKEQGDQQWLEAPPLPVPAG